MDSQEIVHEFWDAMKSNDFVKASEWLSADFEGYWPQSSELVIGRANFVDRNIVV